MAWPFRGASVAYAMRDRHLIVLDAVVPALVGAAIVVGETLHGGASARPAPIMLGIGAAAVLLTRRRWPVWTLASSGAFVVILFHVDETAASIAVLAPAVALYSVALRRGRTQQLAAGAVAVAAVIGADVIHHGRPTVSQTLAHVLLVALPLLAAEVMRTHRANVRLLTERLELSEQAREQEAEHRAEQERLRIVREVHDVVAHTLTAVNVTAAAAAETSRTGDAQAALEQIERASHDAISELRGILGVLRGADTTEAPRAPTPGIADIAELVNRANSTGLDITLHVHGSPPPHLSQASSLGAYRIVQESLTNVRRHAAGADTAVTLRFDATELSVTIDNGPADRDPDPNGSDGIGIGIVGMRERARLAGGRLDAGPHDAGFRVRADLPYESAR